jgi:uncharacterized protein YqfA (UPF0365 family)
MRHGGHGEGASCNRLHRRCRFTGPLRVLPWLRLYAVSAYKHDGSGGIIGAQVGDFRPAALTTSATEARVTHRHRRREARAQARAFCLGTVFRLLSGEISVNRCCWALQAGATTDSVATNKRVYAARGGCRRRHHLAKETVLRARCV